MIIPQMPYSGGCGTFQNHSKNMKKQIQNALQVIFHSGDYQATHNALNNMLIDNANAQKVLNGAICPNPEDTYNAVRRLIKVWC